MKKDHAKLLDLLERDQLLATMPSGLFLVDCDKTIVYWNREAERITGYSSAEVIGQHCSFLEGIECGSGCGLFDPETPAKPIIGVKCRIRSKHGKQLYIIKNIDLLRHDDEVIGGIESFIDISEQKGLEEALRRHGDELEETVRERTSALEEERTRLRSVLDSMTDFAYIISPDFRISFLNRALANHIGPVEGEICYQALHNEIRICENCPMSRAMAGETVREERVFPLSGRTYEVIHTPLYSTDGDQEKLAVCRDITERMEANQRLREANRQLDAFVYTVSHDLRSPLTPIIGFAEFLKDEYRDRLDDQGLELLAEIETQGNRMLALLEDLLELSRVGHVPPPETPVDASAVLQDVLTDLASEAAEKQAAISSTPLPRLLLPESLIGEMLSNLLRNALRYGCPAPDCRIEVEGEETSRQATLRVVDHGPGITDADKARVCDVFFRGADSKHLPGTGIGLATVQKIVRLYDGSLELLDTPGGGCTVCLKFPNPAPCEQ